MSYLRNGVGSCLTDLWVFRQQTQDAFRLVEELCTEAIDSPLVELRTLRELLPGSDQDIDDHFDNASLERRSTNMSPAGCSSASPDSIALRRSASSRSQASSISRFGLLS